MASSVTIDQVHSLAAQLPPRERLKLAAKITDELSETLAVSSKETVGDDQSWAERSRLADELLAEIDAARDDSQGSLDSVGLIRRMRDERTERLCPKGA